MMFFYNKNNNHGFSKQTDERHKTHVTALVLLVLATLVVVLIALSMAGSQAPVDRSQAPTNSAQQINGSGHGSLQPVSGLSGLPSNVPVPQTASVVQNYRNNLTDGQTQRILVFETGQASSSGVFDQLQSWATANEFAITQTDRTNGSGIILAEKPSAQLIISWSETQQSTRVEINHVRM